MFQTARGNSMCKGPEVSINLMCDHDVGIKSQELGDRVGEARKPDGGKEFGRHSESASTLQHHGEWTVGMPRVGAGRPVAVGGGEGRGGGRCCSNTGDGRAPGGSDSVRKSGGICGKF